MKISKLILVLLTGMFLVSGAGCIASSEGSTAGYDILWSGTQPDEGKTIETKISQQIDPYPGMEYDNVTVSALKENGRLRVHVIAMSAGAQYPDLYDFTYRDGELIQVGYLLEAIPESVRSEAIGVAMQSEEIMSKLGSGTSAYANPSVKRILPATAEKFHAPKTLISVTWTDSSVSALADMDTREVVQVWNGQ